MDYNHLELFFRVAEHESFTAAARALGIQRSSLSRRIAALEKSLGVALFHRTTRKVSMTPSGEWLLSRIEPLMVGIAQAVEAIPERASDPSGILRVSLAADIGLHIAPFLHAFHAQHPRIKVELIVSPRMVDLEAERIDVALRAAASGLTDSRLIARLLMTMTAGIYAAPAHLENHPAPERVEDLVHHPMLMTPVMLARFEHPTGPPALIANEPLVLKACVEAGLGLGWLPTFMAEEAVLADRLVRILPDLSLDGLKLFAVFPPALRDLPKVRAFVDGLAVYLGSPTRPGLNPDATAAPAAPTRCT